MGTEQCMQTGDGLGYIATTMATRSGLAANHRVAAAVKTPLPSAYCHFTCTADVHWTMNKCGDCLGPLPTRDKMETKCWFGAVCKRARLQFTCKNWQPVRMGTPKSFVECVFLCALCTMCPQCTLAACRSCREKKMNKNLHVKNATLKRYTGATE